MAPHRPALSVVPEPPADPEHGRGEPDDTMRAIRAGEVDAFVVTGEDGERVLSLAQADGPYRLFVEHMQEGAATVSSSGHILYANARLAEMLSLTRTEIVGSALTTHAATTTGHWHSGETGATTEFDLVDSSGALVPVLVSSAPLDVDGEQFTCLTFADMTPIRAHEREISRLNQVQADQLTQLQLAQDTLTQQATHDALTGLPNRTLLVDRLGQALAQAQRSGLCVAVLFVDLDRFKRINDTLGHAAGDAMLRHVGETLIDALRPMDTVARLGGDEFIVLAPAVADRMQALEMSRRVNDRLAAEPTQDGVGIIASIGVALSVAGRGTAELLLHEADNAMYAAKSLGGGRVEVFDPALGRQAEQRIRTRQMLELALDERRVIAQYQPIVDVPTGALNGFEALARIELPDGSLLLPSAFIPIAEETGLVVPLGSDVLARACQTAATWPSQCGGRGLTVAVNVSARQLARQLAEVVTDTLRDSGLDPTRLHLELTETAVMDLHPDTLKELGRLRDLGVEIGLDDFGTGYASLTHLRRLPLTFVKIDQSFVQEIAVGSEDERIVAAVIDLAANLGLRSIGEGVETEEQLARLRDLGCDQAQGFYFAAPMPADEVPAALRG